MPPKRAIRKKVEENSNENAPEVSAKENPIEQAGKGKRTKKIVVTVETDDVVTASSAPETTQVKRRGRSAKNPEVPGKDVSQTRTKRTATTKVNENITQAVSEKVVPAEKKARGRQRAIKSSSEDVAQNGKESAPDKAQAKQSTRKAKASKTAETIVSEEPPIKKSKTTEQDISDEEEVDWQNAESIYEFKANDINGKSVPLQKYKGNVCIIVNVASKCGHTKSNYEQFVELFDEYSKQKGLKILAFPCNQFGKQEPGDSQKICEFAKKRNVKFDMFEKIDVNGKNAHPLWKFLTNKIAGPKGNAIEWNFTKFIIDKEGNVVERHKSAVKPNQMVEMLEKYW